MISIFELIQVAAEGKSLINGKRSQDKNKILTA
jgi:hypothetical protein